MISIRALVGLVACCAGSLAMGAAALAAGKNPGGYPSPADAQLITEWMQVVNSADAVTLRHRADLHRPVRFKSRKPCVYRVSKVVGEERFEGTGPARFAQELGLGERLPDESSCHSLCRIDSRVLGVSGDTLVSQSLELTFRRSGRDVTFDIDCPGETARISDESKRWACLPLAQRMPGLIALARQNFPWDTLLDQIRPCEPAPADSGSPTLGTYVYIEELPEVIERQPPKYPFNARETGAAGTVLVQALIGKDGNVKGTAIVESIASLDQAAVQAVEQWRFRPAMSNGKPVAVWVAVPVKFTLRD